MADNTNDTPTPKNSDVQDPSVTFGDTGGAKKIDAVEEEVSLDLPQDTGEGAMANLHFGTRPEAEFLKSEDQPEELEDGGLSSKLIGSDPDLETATLAENVEGAIVGTLASYDVEAGDVSYTVSDDRFEVVGGELRLVDGVSVDFETAASLDVTVTATGADGIATEETISIEVVDVNEAPFGLDLDGSSVAENAPGAVIGTLSSFDPDSGDTVIYTVSDDRFEIVDGELRLAEGVSLDHEEAASIDVEITATDGDGLSTTETFSIDVTDVNEGPSDLALDGDTIAENSEGAVVGTLSSFDPDADDTATYTVSDDRFEVVDGELRLAEGVSLDHEAAESIDVSVTVTDSQGLSSTETFEINVADVNEGPTDLELDGSVVSENSEGAVVGTLSSFDPDAGDSITYSVSDDRFEVVDGELRLAEGVSLDHEEAASINVEVTATDGEGLSTSETFSIDVADLNEGPSDLSLEGDTVAENSEGAVVGTLSSFDPDAGDTATYTVSDDRFEVVDGELRLAEGVSLDHEEATSIEVEVAVTDGEGLSTTESFEINVADVNEGPTDLELDGTSVAENAEGAVIGTLSSFDPDAGDTATYTVSDNRFEVVDGELRLAEGVSLDHEAAESIDVSVTVTDSEGLSSTETFEINVADVNEGPSDLALDGDTVAENSEGAVVGTLSSFDPDAGDTVEYTVSDDRFEVVDGELRLAEGVSLDHEDAASIEVEVTATDSEGLSTSESFEINVADVNEGPSNLALDGDTVAENSEGAVVGALSSFDPDADDTVEYTVSDDRFEVVDGELRLAEGVSLDHEAAESIDVTVTATDSEGLSTSESFEINVADVNEGPSDLALDGDAVAENSEGAVVGTLSSFDPDAGDTVEYTVSDDRFEVVDGELRLAEGVSLDHEEAETLQVEVTATDSEGLSTSESFEINVADVNEGPSDLALDGDTVAENSEGAVIGTLSSFDPDAGDAVEYTVSDDRFEVVDGELRLAEGVSLDHEEAETLQVEVTATDSEGLSTSESFDINVADVNEGPSDLALDGDTVAENSEGAVVGTLSSFDPDAGDTVEYSVSDDRFEVVDGELRLAEGVSLNHEEVESIQVEVTATDSEGLSTTESFDINVTDVNEGPSDLALDGDTVAENSEGAVVGTLSSFDPDAGDTVEYSVSDDRFEVVDGELRLAEGVSLNHEEVASIQVEVTATDSEGLSTTESFDINVADVNEAPTDLTLTLDTTTADADFSAADGYNGTDVQNLGLESDQIVFTMSFTTGDDVDGAQTLFETGGSGTGTNVVINDGMLEIYAGNGNDLELSVPIEAGTTYNIALELDLDGDTIKLLMSDELELSEMNESNSLVASHDDFTDRDYSGGNNMAVGDDSGNAQGRVGGEFQGTIEGPGLEIYSDATFEDVFIEAGVEENSEGAVVGSISAFDPDDGDSLTYTVSDDRFEVVDGELRLVEGVTLDHEAEAEIAVTVTATDEGGLSTSETFTVDVVDVNEAPTDLSLDNNTIDENSTEGVVGTVSVTDPDVGDTHTYSLVDNEGQPFAIDAETGEISLVSPGVPEGSVLHINASETGGLEFGDSVSSIQDLSGENNSIAQSDANDQPTLVEDGPFGQPGLSFDGENDRLDIADDAKINLSSQGERSFALTIKTGEDVESRQVVYEEGGTVNGFNFYIDDGQLYMGAWSESTGWDFQSVSIEIEPGESYSISAVYDGASGTYTGYVNGESIGTVEVGDTMSGHSGNIGLGGIAQHTVFHDGDSGANEGFYFEGSVGEFVVFNDALDSSEVAGIDMELRGIEPQIDFETQDSYDLTVQVTDAAGESYQEVVTINVNDLNEGPTDLTLDGSSVAENSEGVVVGTLSSFDPDADDSVAYTVSDDRFEVVDGELRLADGVSLDHEDAETIQVEVTATDSDGQSITESFDIQVTDVNEGPSDLALDGDTVAENSDGAVVGTLSSFDPDAGDTATYTVSDDRFEVVDGELRLADGVSLDHEAAETIDVSVTVTDSEGLSATESFEINVADVNEGPSDLALDGDAVAENAEGAVVGTLSSFDPDAGDSVSYSVSDDRFEVVDRELRLAEGVSLNHEDAETIQVEVTATDSEGFSTSESFDINVTDVNEGPSDLALDGDTVAENSEGTVVGTLSSFDPDAGDTATYTVSDDRFEVVDGELRLAEGVSLDYEAAETIDVSVTVTDSEGLSATESFEINVADVNEGPSDLALDGDTVAENSEGAVVGTLSSFDPDADDSVTYSVSDDRFEIVDGELRLADGVSLNHEDAETIQVEVTATDSEGLATTESFDINVTDVNEGPSDLALDGDTVAENSEGAVVGALSTFDPDAGDTIEYTVSDDRFEVVDGELRLADGVSLDHEEAASIQVDVTATDSEGLSTSESFDINVADVNEAPTSIELSAAPDAFLEQDGLLVIEAENYDGANAGDGHAWSESDAHEGMMHVDDGSNAYDMWRSESDVENDSPELTYTIHIDTPGTYYVHVLGAAEDGPRGNADSVHIGIDGDRITGDGGLTGFGSDAEWGAHDTYTGEVIEVTFDTAGTHELNLWAREDGVSVDQIVLTQDPNFDPEAQSLEESPRASDMGIIENDAGAVVGTLSSFDPDAGDSVTYTVSDDRFEVVDGELRLADGESLNHEEAATLDIEVTATDSGGLSTSETFTIDVVDINEGPSDLALDGDTVAENSEGAVVGTLSSFDPDAGDSVSYSVSDDRFEVVDGELRLADGVSLDHEEAASIQVDVTATDSQGASTTESFDIEVTDLNEAPSDLTLSGTDGVLSLNQDGGTDDNAISSNVSDFPTDAITVEVTFTADGMPEGSGAPLFSYAAGGSGGNDVLLWGESSSGNLAVFLDGKKYGTDIENADLFDGEEHTLSFTWDEASGELNVFVDGELEYSQSVSVSGLEADGTITLGQEQDREGGSYDSNQVFQGEISEVRIYDEALSEEQVADNAAGDVAQDGLVTHWDMSEAEGGVVSDLAGNNDLVLENGAEIAAGEGSGAPSVDENAEGAVVGTVSAFDPDAGDSITYTVSDDRFEVVDGELRLADGESLDHEAAESLNVTVTATDSGGLETSETFSIDVNDVNEAPTDLTFETSSENLITGGSFETQDVRTGGWRGFGEDTSGNWETANGIEIWDNLWGTEAADGAQFVELDYTGAQDAISQTVTTEPGQVYTLSLDVKSRTASTTDTIEIYWNGELVDVVDPSSTDWETVSFEVIGTGGDDVLEFREAEGESDGLGAHLDNVSLIEVPLTVAEGAEGAVFGTFSATDPDEGDSVTFSVSDDRFEIVDGELRLADGQSLDYEEASTIDVVVTATDSSGLETSETVTINVADVDDTPTVTTTQKVVTEAAEVENGEITTGNGGGSGTSTVVLSEAVSDSSEIVIDFGHIDNSFQVEVNGQSITDEIIQLQSNAYDDSSEVMLVFEDGTPAASPWVPTSDGSPRFQVVVTEEGVEIYGTRNPGSTELEPMTLEGGEFNAIDLVDGDNSVTVINPDGTGPDGLSATVTGEYDAVVDVQTVTGTDGDDRISGSEGEDVLVGGDGNDLFIFDADTASANVDGGEGWTDTIDLSAATDNGAVYGDDWTVTLTEGEIVSEDAESLTLTDDAAGFIEFENGNTIEFENIDQIGF